MDIRTGQWEIFFEYKRMLGLGEINNKLHNFKVALMLPTYTPDTLSQRTWNDISSHELVAYGYNAGGNSIPIRYWEQEPSTENMIWSGEQVDFILNEYSTVKYFVVYNNSKSSKPLVCWTYINGNETEVNGLRFRVKLDEGILKLKSN